MTVPRVAGYEPIAGEVVYLLVADTLILALGTARSVVLPGTELAFVEVISNVYTGSEGVPATVVTTGPVTVDGGPIIVEVYAAGLQTGPPPGTMSSSAYGRMAFPGGWSPMLATPAAAAI